MTRVSKIIKTLQEIMDEHGDIDIDIDIEETEVDRTIEIPFEGVGVQ